MDDTDLVGVLAEWCAIPSTVGDSAGAAEMRAAVAARLAATGALIRDHPLADGTHALVGRMRPEHTLQLLVVAHTDTPYGADHPVRRATREGDRLVGPGAAEMKGGIVVALAALAAFETTADSGGLGWTLAVIPDGVHGAPQSGMLVRELARGAAVVAVMGRAAPGANPFEAVWGSYACGSWCVAAPPTRRATRAKGATPSWPSPTSWAPSRGSMIRSAA